MPNAIAAEYELWIAHGDKRAYVHRDDHWSYASNHGWFSTNLRFSSADLERMQIKPHRRLNEKKAVLEAIFPEPEPTPEPAA